MALANITQLSTSAIKKNIFNDRFLYNVNRDSFAKISANSIFDSEFKNNLFNEDSLYIITGSDSGLLPKYIEEQGVPSGTRYLFIELDEILQQLTQHQLINTNNDEIIYSTLDSWEEDARKLKLKEYCYLRSVVLIEAICTQQANIPEYTELKWQIAENLQGISFQYSNSMGSELFTVRQIQNIADNIIPAKLLHNIYHDQSAIILAGGPSLTSALPWVKENRSKLIIFAVSRIARQLIDHHIEPDFIFSVDPQSTNIDVSKEMFQFKKSIFIHSYHADSSLINQWEGTKLYLGTQYPWHTEANPDNINSTGPTVSNTAVSAAHYFGCKQILLAGFDLCYTKEGITHAKGSDEALSGPKYNSSLLQVKTYSGDMRTTEPEFYIALRNLGKQAEFIKDENKLIINLSIDAAQADNIEHHPCEEIELDKDCSNAIELALQKIPSISEEEENNQYKLIITELKKTIHHINLIKKLSERALKINDEMYNVKGEILNYKDKKSLDKIEKKLNKQHRHYSTLVKNFSVRNFIKITSPHDYSDSWDAEKTKEIGKTYYESYVTGSKKLLSFLNESLLRTNARLEEKKTTPDFHFLIKQWKKDNSYNRAAIWRAHNPTTPLPQEVEDQFEYLHQEFQKILNEKETTFKIKNQGQSALTFLKTKAILLFKHNKLEDLKNLEASISLIQDKEKSPYLSLVSAYIAELENNVDLALQHYNDTINYESSPLLEEALLRITSINITLNDHINAHLALMCLSQISPLYLPYFAESSRIIKNTLDAIEAYLSYIDFFPDDILCQLKLVNIYIEIEAYEPANIIIDNILMNEPEHKMANILKKQIAT